MGVLSMTINIINNNLKNSNLRFTDNRDKSFDGLLTSNYDKNVTFERYNIPPKTDKKLEAKVFCTTLVGVSAALALVLKKKNYSINPLKIFRTPIKDWGVIKVKEYNEIDIPILAAGSVGGGLFGGLAFDKKENRKAKLREAVIQMVGNILTPLSCVYLGSKAYKKYEAQILSKLPQFKNEAGKKLPKFINTAIKCIPGIGTVAISLATGIMVGNKVGNAINHKAFHRHDQRKVRLDDFSAHIDDTCLAVSLVAKKDSPIGFINKIVPAALMVAGVSTGVAKEKNEG